MMAELLIRIDHGMKDRPGLLAHTGLDGAYLDGAEANDVALLDGVDLSCVNRAKSALAQSRIYDLRRLVVIQDDGAIVLRGRVSSFYHKQLAQEIVRSAAEGVEVVNALRVVYHADRRDAELERAG
jgi:hypothetical protein